MLCNCVKMKPDHDHYVSWKSRGSSNFKFRTCIQISNSIGIPEFGIQNSKGCRGSLTDSLTDKNQKNDPLQLPSVAAAAVLD